MSIIILLLLYIIKIFMISIINIFTLYLPYGYLHDYMLFIREVY